MPSSLFNVCSDGVKIKTLEYSLNMLLHVIDPHSIDYPRKVPEIRFSQNLLGINSDGIAILMISIFSETKVCNLL